MTVTIGKGDAFRGIPLIKVRNVLKGWRGGSSDVGELAARKDINLDPRIVLALLQESEDLGFIVEEELHHGRAIHGLTPSGRAIAYSEARQRTPKAKARTILDDFLDNAHAASIDRKFPFKVDRIWLFGSMIDEGKSDVGDIDVVVETSRMLTPTEIERPSGWYRDSFIRRVVKSHEGDLPQAVIYGGDEEEYVMNRRLYGKRRHPIFSPNNIDILGDLHCPCQLVYDSARGGRVSDPVLPHHPESRKRGDNIRERLVMPDLEMRQRSLAPTSASWLSKPGHFMVNMLKNRHLLHLGYGDWASPAGDQDLDAHVVTDREELVSLAGRDAADSFGEIDARRRFAMVVCPWDGEGKRASVFEVSRDIEMQGQGWAATTRVKPTSSGRLSLSRVSLMRFRTYLSALMGSDLYRLAERREAMAVDVPITARIAIDLKGGWGQVISHSFKAIEATEPDFPYLGNLSANVSWDHVPPPVLSQTAGIPDLGR